MIHYSTLASSNAATAATIDTTTFARTRPVTPVPEPGWTQEVPIAYFLAKTDPDTYSIGDFERERKTVWDGVVNLQAVRAILAMLPGDRVFIYQSGAQPRVVGLAVVRSAGRPDPRNPKSAVADLEFAGRLDPPTTLEEIKQSKRFEDWALVRQGRLSTMPAPQKFVDWMRKRYPAAAV